MNTKTTHYISWLLLTETFFGFPWEFVAKKKGVETSTVSLVLRKVALFFGVGG